MIANAAHLLAAGLIVMGLFPAASFGQDLVPQSITVSPDPVSSHGTVTVTWNLVNQGSATANSSTTVVRIESTSSCPITSQNGVGTPSLSVGQWVSQSTTMIAPASGTYYVCVIADDYSTSGQISAQAANDIQVVGPFTVQAPATSVPDLIPQSISVSPNPVTPYGNLSVAWNLVNQGSGAASSSTTVVRIESSDSCPITSQNTVGAPSMGAGQSVSQSITMMAPGSGTYYVCVIADDYGTSGQTSTTAGNDIQVAGPFTVQTPIAAVPDLIPKSISLTPDPVAPNGSVTVSWNLLNQGSGTASPSTTVVRIESSNSCAIASQSGVRAPSLTAGQSVSQSITMIAPGAGTYYVCVIADDFGTSGQVSTQTANDIQIVGPFTVQAQVASAPDLIPQSISVSPDPVAPNGMVTVSWSLVNQGSGTASSSTTAVRIETSSTCSITSQSTMGAPAVGAGQSVSQSTTTIAPGSGTYYVCVIADDYGTSGQNSAATANDIQIAGPFTVQTPVATAPDLIPQSINVTPDPVAPNGSVTVSWNLANQGSGTARASTTVVRIETSNSCPLALTSQTSVAAPQLGPAQSLSESTIMSAPASGTYYVCVIADDYGTSGQSSTVAANDIQVAGPFTVQARVAVAPDLLPQSISVSSDPVAPNGSVAISWNLVNQGSGTASPSTTAVRIESSNSCAPSSQVSVATPSLASGQSVSQSTTTNAPASGTYYVCVIADDYGTSGETFTAAANDPQVAGPFSVNFAPASATSNTNYTALWWNPRESGWGLNVNQQGDIIFATLFIYGHNGQPMWLVMSNGARQGSADVFSGDLYLTSGPPFNLEPYPGFSSVRTTRVGSMKISFTGPDNGSLDYTINGEEETKAIQKQVYGSAPTACQSTDGDRSSSTNYQDLWFNPAEPGWGLNITHQDEVIFATLFTYATDGTALWLVMPNGSLQSDGVYSGPLYQTSGSAFDASGWSGVSNTQVGTMRLRFTDGVTGTLSYSLNGASVTKAITRQTFSNPMPVCATVSSPFLQFPLKCTNASCSTPYIDGAYSQMNIDGRLGFISSVLDHHTSEVYIADGTVVAFTGEHREGVVNQQMPGCSCYLNTSVAPIQLQGLYRGTADSSYGSGLNYDGHPGYDIYAEVGTPVYSAADGTVVNYQGHRCIPKGIPAGCDAWGYIGIDHGNGYVTQYGHLSARYKQPGDQVHAGELIGLSGYTAPAAEGWTPSRAHLHFEVLKSGNCKFGYCVTDPYGWEGQGVDPLIEATQMPSVRLWK
ncbi:MAG TPA: CARDB domain-containing protein [Usitatibacter sp.]|nr:CARDB domain-containing protein [Usitatibacter sp.]